MILPMMTQKIEGILIAKVPIRERDVVGKLLLRSGKRVSVLFYGGQGGGKKMKPSSLELGHMLQIELKTSPEQQELYSAKEWTPLWTASSIRFNHQAFYFLCLMLEVAAKISLEDNLHDQHQQFDRESEGIFRVLSNAIFYLEDAAKNQHFKLGQHLPLFIGKNMLEQGIFPSLDDCISCGIPLGSHVQSVLSPELGGFQCLSCFMLANKVNANIPDEEHNALYRFFEQVSQTRYADYQLMGELSTAQMLSIFKFFCYQFHWQLKDFLSYPFLF